jgi:hypothetical protein
MLLFQAQKLNKKFGQILKISVDWLKVKISNHAVQLSVAQLPYIQEIDPLFSRFLSETNL